MSYHPNKKEMKFYKVINSNILQINLTNYKYDYSV